MEPNLFKYIWQHSRREQIAVLLIVLVSLPFYFLSLNLPKQIVNQPIQGVGFETPGATQEFLNIVIPLPGFLADAMGVSQSLVLFEGAELERVPFLIALSLLYLALVAVNGLFKFVVNTLKGSMGERMLRRLRYQLFDRVLRFPTTHFRRVRASEVSTMIKDEVEPLGGFIGDAFVQPAFLGGQALTALIFIMVQSFWLGAVALAVVLLQALLIPKLRRPILELGRARQLAARDLAGRVGEVVESIPAVHAHDTSHLERADISSRLGRIFDIRYEIYRRKFFVKFLNNFLAKVTPFVFYTAGGYLAIIGSMDIGALVAALVAYNDLPTPIKELIDWDQRRADVQIKYEQVIEQFSPDDILDPCIQDPHRRKEKPFQHKIAVKNLTLADDTGVKVLDGISFEVPLSEHVAVVGRPGGGKDFLGLVLARLLFPTAGSIVIDGEDLADMPEAVTGQRISYVGPEAQLFPQSIKQNLVYGLKHQPLREPDYDETMQRSKERELQEARRAGNSPYDLEADWIDYAAAGASGPLELDSQIVAALNVVAMDDDVYHFGLRGTIDPVRAPNVAAEILKARRKLRERLDDPAYSGLVEPFDPMLYNSNATLAENLLFGTPIAAEFDGPALAENGYVLEILRKAGIATDVLRMGLSIAETMVELFCDLPPDHPFFVQFSFIAPEDLPDYELIIQRASRTAIDDLSSDDKARLRCLPFQYVEARHRMGLIDEAMQAKVLEARRAFAANLPPHLAGAIEFYDPARYNMAATLQDNILFGRIAYGIAGAETKIDRLIGEVLDTLSLRPTVFQVGLEFNVGAGGRRLTGGQRQKLGLARAVLKRPDILIVSEALTMLDGATKRRILENVKKDREGMCLVWILNQAKYVDYFDRILVVEDGRLIQHGTLQQLNGKGTRLNELLVHA